MEVECIRFMHTEGPFPSRAKAPVQTGLQRNGQEKESKESKTDYRSYLLGVE